MMTPEQLHERNSKLLLGYTAFVVALLFAVIAKSNEYPRSYIVICLFAVSLPSLVTFVLFDFIVLVSQSDAERGFRKLAVVLGFVPSFIGITFVIDHFSGVAALLFVLVTVFWAVVIYVLGPR